MIDHLDVIEESPLVARTLIEFFSVDTTDKTEIGLVIELILKLLSQLAEHVDDDTYVWGKSLP
jgi:hypothetical protein